MTPNNYFIKNLNYRIEKYKHFYKKSSQTFRSEVKECIERFEEVFRRNAMSFLIKELHNKKEE
ncbi:MAG: hypothetical protein BAJALOKI2v1_100055 [Promethearchaeota archaeon]|nr:MAG: hypothetical protein BAJALOKI2v1_100055 [Candidatus Lokiarchaeota archaeon]